MWEVELEVYPKTSRDHYEVEEDDDGGDKKCHQHPEEVIP
jgi:hypothetical protein